MKDESGSTIREGERYRGSGTKCAKKLRGASNATGMREGNIKKPVIVALKIIFRRRGNGSTQY